MVPGPAELVSYGNLSEMHILGLYPRSTESERLGWGLAICPLTSPPEDSDLAEVKDLLTVRVGELQFLILGATSISSASGL